jgi:hypothetical protein
MARIKRVRSPQQRHRQRSEAGRTGRPSSAQPSIIDPQPEPFTAEELARLKVLYLRASTERKIWLWRFAFSLGQGLTAEQATRVARPRPLK